MATTTTTRRLATLLSRKEAAGEGESVEAQRCRVRLADAALDEGDAPGAASLLRRVLECGARAGADGDSVTLRTPHPHACSLHGTDAWTP